MKTYISLVAFFFNILLPSLSMAIEPIERLNIALTALPVQLAEHYQEQLEVLKRLPQNEETFLLASQVLAKAGGDVILSIRDKVRKGEDLGLEYKNGEEPVTIADKKSNEIICAGIEYLFPTHGIYSEEIVQLQPYQKEYTWVIDPLDGTREFKKAAEGRNVTNFGVHVAVVKEERSILGTTHFPALDVTVWAAQGRGTYKQVGANQPEKIVIEPSTNELDIQLLMSRSVAIKKEDERLYRTLFDLTNPTEEDEANFRNLFSEVINDNGQDVIYPIGKNLCIRVGGCGLKGCMVLYGPGNVYMSYGQHDWDVASWAIAVQEAGGIVTDWKGKELTFKNKGPMPFGILVARTPELHAKAISAIAQNVK